MPVTIKDIARIAGVSHSTVSRGLNGKPGVSDGMREKIRQIANDLGFEFNANARSLSTARTGTIGIIYDEENNGSTLHIYSMDLLRFMRQSLERENLDAIITFQENRFTGSSNIEKLINRRKVDGLIIISSRIGRSTYDFLREKNFPFVISHLIPEDIPDYADSVYCDHHAGGRIAGEHLMAKGCKNLLCIARKEDRLDFSSRTGGFSEAVTGGGLSFSSLSVLNGGRTFRDSYNAVMNNQDLVKKSDGIFAHTDLLALGAISALSELGITVPGDICVAGYDDTELCTFFRPALTSVQQPVKQIADISCRRLITLIDSPAADVAKKTILPPVLVPRSSTMRPGNPG